MTQKNAVVLGAGGFIGSHLCKYLKQAGYRVRGVDLRPSKYINSCDEFIVEDLRNPCVVKTVIPYECDRVYVLAALMGGAGFIFTGLNDADIFYNNALINLNVANVAVKKNIKQLFFASSACAYSQDFQKSESNNKLSEDMAIPANPDSDYGWEKLLSEKVYQAYNRNYGLNIRIARFHNIYGPMCDFYTGKEKAPAAVCRKVLTADNEIEIWGSGNQVRTFLYIDDCLDAIELLMKSNHKEPINIGSEENITINDLTKMVVDISGKTLSIRNIIGPVGVAGRSSDNMMIKEILGWEPKVPLRQGMKNLYEWIGLQYAIMPFIYEKDDKGNIRKFITEHDVNNKNVRYYL